MISYKPITLCVADEVFALMCWHIKGCIPNTVNEVDMQLQIIFAYMSLYVSC